MCLFVCMCVYINKYVCIHVCICVWMWCIYVCIYVCECGVYDIICEYNTSEEGNYLLYMYLLLLFCIVPPRLHPYNRWRHHRASSSLMVGPHCQSHQRIGWLLKFYVLAPSQVLSGWGGYRLVTVHTHVVLLGDQVTGPTTWYPVQSYYQIIIILNQLVLA